MSSGFLHREFPAELRDLADLALDLRWTTSLLTRRIWQRLDPEAWERSESPYLILQDASEEQLKAAARDQVLLDELAWWRKKMMNIRPVQRGTAPTMKTVICGAWHTSVWNSA